MENEKFAQVWQRVQTPPEPAQGMPELIAREKEDAVIYLHLSRVLRGRDSVLLRQMFQQEQTHAACLKGIYRLSNDALPEIRIPNIPKETPEVLLRRCYGREMRCLAAYEARASHPEYGAVFGRLAEQERAHCHNILEILGRLQKT